MVRIDSLSEMRKKLRVSNGMCIVVWMNGYKCVLQTCMTNLYIYTSIRKIHTLHYKIEFYGL